MEVKSWRWCSHTKFAVLFYSSLFHCFSFPLGITPSRQNPWLVIIFAIRIQPATWSSSKKEAQRFLNKDYIPLMDGRSKWYQSIKIYILKSILHIFWEIIVLLAPPDIENFFSYFKKFICTSLDYTTVKFQNRDMSRHVKEIIEILEDKGILFASSNWNCTGLRRRSLLSGVAQEFSLFVGLKWWWTDHGRLDFICEWNDTCMSFKWKALHVVNVESMNKLVDAES